MWNRIPLFTTNVRNNSSVNSGLERKELQQVVEKPNAFVGFRILPKYQHYFSFVGFSLFFTNAYISLSVLTDVVTTASL
jgi:hypothetical protein